MVLHRTKAELEEVPRVGDALWKGVKGIGKTIGRFFGSQQHPPSQPSTGGWHIGAIPYAPYKPQGRGDFAPGKGHVPASSWVNSREGSGPLQTNVVMGDSIGAGMRGEYPGVRNTSVVGVTIGGAMSQFRQVPSGSSADVYLGSNNGWCTLEDTRRQTREFLKRAEAQGVQLNHWILPGNHERHSRDDARLKEVAGVIEQTIREYNQAHPSPYPIRTVVTRDQGIRHEPDGLHLTATGCRQVKDCIAKQARVPVASAEHHAPPNGGWRIGPVSRT
jgi:hypothetical protein